MSDGPLDRYLALCASGELQRDPAQEAAARRLQTLSAALAGYRHQQGGGLIAALFGRKAKGQPPRGVYLWGRVGGGKSLLMDIFFEAAPVERKRRVHFHAFMQEIHRAIHAEREGGNHGKDTIGAVADMVVERAWLLCFDEFHVTDIADAMILGRLFDKLFERGVVIVATSNRAPSDLYAGGINRELFLPFIAMIEQRLDVVQVTAQQDYRLAFLAARDVYLVPADEAARKALDEAFEHLIGGADAEPATVEVQGRTIAVPCQARQVARFGFADLCARPLGAADYLALAERFHTFVIDAIPLMAPERRNEAARFVTLIDVLYDNRVGLVCSAEAQPDELYRRGDGAFEFERTASRLIEMRSADYLEHVRG
jgi:cell division protein ZapE